MDGKDLLWFSSGFRTVNAWRDAMFAHGYTMPAQLCHELHGAMKRLELKFPEAFRLLWDRKKIAVTGRALLYDPTASMLWDAGLPPAVVATLPATAWDRDVLALVPPTEDIARLESLWCVAPETSPLMKLALERPTDEFDQLMREYLQEFGDDVLAATWKSAPPQEAVPDEQAYARLKELAFKDEVTGLYNRRFFSSRLEEEIYRHWKIEHAISVVLTDLDDFKAVNDDLGYAAGDEILQGMAEILLRHTGGVNVVCRYGGNRFATLLVDTSKGGARLYADRIRYMLSSHHFAHKRPVTASFGIASLPEDCAPLDSELIRAADEALCLAKHAGKNRIGVLDDIN
jgi:diguanylate cyclase (GGDEF)-like protein